jgi:hypothetical protein
MIGLETNFAYELVQVLYLSYFLYPGFKGTICKSFGPRRSMIDGEIWLFLSFKDSLINKKTHALVVWSWKCKNCSCKAANYAP